MTEPFEDLDKYVKPVKKKIDWNESKSALAENASVDWGKIIKLVLKLLEGQLPASTYKIVCLIADAILKKRSKLSLFIYGTIFTSVQVLGIYKLVSMLINLF
jgi:hypothetical protein